MNPHIVELWGIMAKGWAAGDAHAFASVFAADVEFVTVRGEEHHGREAVEGSHATLFATTYNRTLLKPEVRLVRELADGFALVHALSTVYPVGITTHAQALVRCGPNGWSIVAFHNMIPGGTPR
ncbi:SgcJ/EcaC family oxidoreductase [Kibdelosporangium lantanae]|uniref:SgcJ/EcaC family oxidoreductase n=1 Tax=Kibdelosporangium lantanae TaxID=1497396 RepID=A0ABW3M989_9PSEU